VSVVAHFPITGCLTAEALDDVLTTLSANRDHAPFSEAAMGFCAALSADLFRRGTAYPQLIALAYWLRPAAIARIREHFNERYDRSSVLSVPRGLAYHLPPRNVDTIFAYSWILSLLAGNSNIVRLPEALSPVAMLILDAIAKAASEPIRQSNLFVCYPRDEVILQRISRHCDLRIVWGGNEKVIEIRRAPLPVNAVELTFGNRFSMAALNSEAYLALDAKERQALAERFYNDVYWFDQMGCSSPRIVFWIGKAAEADTASDAFFAALSVVVRTKGYTASTGTALGKMSYAYRAAIDLPVRRWEQYSNELMVLSLEQPADIRAEVQGGGMLTQVCVDRLDVLASYVRREDQTLTYFGFDQSGLQALVRAINGRGLDRVVPIGSALQFHYLWDGNDLLLDLTRLVHLEGRKE
jgi:hypothetical protein